MMDLDIPWHFRPTAVPLPWVLPGKDNNQGKAYVYTWNGSWQETGLSAVDGSANGYFGFSVALSGDGKELAVGANGNRDNQGKAYLFRNTETGWAAVGVAAQDGGANDYFGVSVALSEDGGTLAVGANGKGNGEGRTYVYRLKGNSVTEAPLAESDGAANDYFGFSVALSSDGNTLAVGSDQKTVGTNSQEGKAYIVRFRPASGS